MAVYPPSGSGGAHMDKAISKEPKKGTSPAKKAAKAAVKKKGK